MNEIPYWIAFAAICYRLREFGDIWCYRGRFKFMETKWWFNQRTREEYNWFHKMTFKIFFDSYHFFGNLARISISTRLMFVDYEIGIACFVSWWIGENLIMKVVTK